MRRRVATVAGVPTIAAEQWRFNAELLALIGYDTDFAVVTGHVNHIRICRPNLLLTDR